MVILLFIIVLFINFAYNFRNYKLCDLHIKRFHEWLSNDEYIRNLNEDRPQVIQLVKNAGMYDTLIPVTRAAGLGQVLNANIRPIQQYPDRTLDIATGIYNQLSSSKGVYKNRMLASINPFAWLEFVIYLPSRIIKYIGFKNEAINRLFNVIWWVFGVIIIPIIITTYSQEISLYIKELLSR